MPRSFHLSGIPPTLVLSQRPRAALAPGEVRVRMRFAALNARDLLVMDGAMPYRPRSDLVPLSDGAGEVTELGSGVSSFVLGDRVMATFRPAWIDGPLLAGMSASDLGGGQDGVLAEERVFSAAALVRVPAGLSLESAACLPCAGVTAWRALNRPRPVEAGEIVLILGTGGVSIAAAQIALAKGARVLATTSSEHKLSRLKESGVDEVIVTADDPDWENEVLARTLGKGADRIVEVGGAGTLARSMQCVAFQGHIALIGLLYDNKAKISPLPLIGKAATLFGVAVGSRRDLEELAAFFADHRLTAVIDRQFPFEEAAAAYVYLRGQGHVGKVVIRCAD